MLGQCSFISQPLIFYDDTRRLVFIDNCMLRFGPSLYTLVKLLLEHQEISDGALSLALYHQANDRNRKLMTRNISKLRTKLITHRLDIQRILNQGYRLVVLPEADQEGVIDEVKRATLALPHQSPLLGLLLPDAMLGGHHLSSGRSGVLILTHFHPKG